MTARKWHKGPPPHIGWWNASSHRSPNIWRWWDGEKWSMPVRDYHIAALAALAGIAGIAARYAKLADTDTAPVEWSDYYPKSARVPRIKP